MTKTATMYELSSCPLRKEDWESVGYLEDFFFPLRRPWLIKAVQSIEDAEDYDFELRNMEINNLRKELPEGYDLRVEFRTTRIIVYDPELYWKDVMAKLDSLAKEAAEIDPVNGDWEPQSWWVNFVDAATGTMIYFRDIEMVMTLNEFLLYMIRQKGRIPVLYIGGIFDIGDE